VAGGIDWFRWHHGSVTDPKFQLVAKKAGARLGDVITVWAFVLEAASADAERGTIGQLDFETLDFLLGADEGTAVRILDAMTTRGLIVGSQIAQWEKRQPKREREDSGATGRQRAKRERDAAQVTNQVNVTPCHATSRQEKPRGEESREEKNSSLRSEGESRKRAAPLPVPDDVDGQVWADWLSLRKTKRAPVTETVLDGARREAAKAGISFEAFLRVWCRRGSQGLEADWLKPHERAGPGQPQSRADRQLETAALLTGARRSQPKPIEAIDVESRAITVIPA
jgi:hypothetical protein